MEEGRNFIKECEEENKEKTRPKLYKESSFKSKGNDAISRIKNEEMRDASESSDGNEEESKDEVMETEDKIGDLPMPKSMFSKPPPKFGSKVKATPIPGIHAEKPKAASRLKRSYEPISWDEVFEEREMIEDTVPIYFSGTTGPVIFCIHGAGHSALSFGPFAHACKDFARVVAFDLRGHGGHHRDDETNMAIDVLLKECMAALKYTVNKHEDASVIICGHSLGGALAAKLAYSIVHPEEGHEPEVEKSHIAGLIVIDVAEGSAISALPFMEQIVESRPTGFDSVAEAVKWGVMSGQVRKLESARVTMPDLVLKEGDKYVWKTNLLGSKDYWKEWFTGMNKCFLGVELPKILVIASNDRMDKELTIAQMQGKFKLVSLLDVGHTIQEDAPDELAEKFKDFIDVFKIQSKYNEKKVITSASGKQIVINH